MKNKLQKIKSKIRISELLNMKFQFTLLLLTSIMAFSSCKKDANEIKPADDTNSTALQKALLSGVWNTSLQESETEEDPSGYKIIMIFSDFNTKTTFKADKTCTEIGKSTVNMTVFLKGQNMHEDTQVLDSDHSGPYNVISESKLMMDLDNSGGIIYDVISFSNSKIELSYKGPMESDGEIINVKLKTVYEK